MFPLLHIKYFFISLDKHIQVYVRTYFRTTPVFLNLKTTCYLWKLLDPFNTLNRMFGPVKLSNSPQATY